MNKKLKVFIAGHNGMVGRSLTNYLKKKEFGKIITASRKRLNLENYDKVNRFIKQKRPDIIINCAGRVGGILANSTFPTEFLNENINIQNNLIKSSFKNKIDHFINLGSSCIYPKNSKQPIKEKYLLSSSLEKTNEAYALAKIVGLKMCEYYNQQYKKSYFTLMPCNLYGPNDNFDLKNSHFIPALIKKIIHSKIKNKRSIEIWGTGSPMREFLHVDDLADALVHLLKTYSGLTHINIGTGEEISIHELAQSVADTVGFNGELVFDSNKPDGAMRKLLDTSKMNKLDWAPSIHLKEGLESTYKWYLQNVVEPT